MITVRDAAPSGAGGWVEESKRWYEEGLRFTCQACGDCCRAHGDYAYVYLAERDVMDISAFLGLTVEAFMEAYCTVDENDWIHFSDLSGDCRFMGEEGRCTIYPVRPKQCATWPFWSENLEDRAVWEGPVAGCCPGIGKGRLYSADEADAIAADNDHHYFGDEQEEAL